MVNAKRHILNLLFHIFFFVILTILTQVGGIIYLCLIPLFKLIKKKQPNKYLRVSLKVLIFIAIYTSVSFLIVPPIAKQFGRVPLPISSHSLKAVTPLTYICNRHYVKPKLKTLLINTAENIYDDVGVVTYYLDANFPFINKFPLLPHLSHNNGKKVDLAFYYTKPNSTVQKHGSPSPIGYGVGIVPTSTEINTAAYCTSKGYWKYTIIDKIMSPFKKSDYTFDEEKTRLLVARLANNDNIEKIFIEPFLVKRFKLNSSKIRFHGCRAVSHADHIHLQIN